MTPTDLFRKGLMGAAILSLGACGMVEDQPNRFEAMAERVADIRLSTHASQDAPGAPVAPARAETAGLRQALRVEVLDPHALWDARDGGLRGVIEAAAPAVAEAAAPAIVQAASDQVSRAVSDHLRPAVSTPVRPGAVIQLGAFHSEASAREAWTRFSTGAARAALEGLTPRFEPVTVNGRELVRLKVGAPADTAAEICRAAQVSDPWCAAAGRA
ncbi:MAG: SPOR domain-containing protein [Brevundimonas sp.]|uniref:SPOR domain-containing protein n=1 Tax=Brevundimonas sp. TaxID=1871086 RepID=UPI00391CAB17